MQSPILVVTIQYAFSFLLPLRYASLFFCLAIDDQENELLALEILHRYVELLDKYFGNVLHRNTHYFGNALCCVVFLQFHWNSLMFTFL